MAPRRRLLWNLIKQKKIGRNRTSNLNHLNQHRQPKQSHLKQIQGPSPLLQGLLKTNTNKIIKILGHPIFYSAKPKLADQFKSVGLEIKIKKEQRQKHGRYT